MAWQAHFSSLCRKVSYIKTGQIQGISFFPPAPWIANSFLYSLRYIMSTFFIIQSCLFKKISSKDFFVTSLNIMFLNFETVKLSNFLFKFRSVFLRSTSRWTEHHIHWWRIYQPDCSLQRCKFLFIVILNGNVWSTFVFICALQRM